jgi:hypothetical protein
MMKSENPRYNSSALSAFFAMFNIKRKDQRNYNCVFEHGQLWITYIDGEQWSVVDAEGPGSINGFDFEQII